MKRELEWIRATPQARTGKSKARIDAFYDLKERAKQRRDNTELQLNVDMRRLGGKILEMEHVSKSYNGINYIRDFDYVFKKGERIGIIGKNGIGNQPSSMSSPAARLPMKAASQSDRRSFTAITLKIIIFLMRINRFLTRFAT